MVLYRMFKDRNTKRTLDRRFVVKRSFTRNTFSAMLVVNGVVVKADIIADLFTAFLKGVVPPEGLTCR